MIALLLFTSCQVKESEKENKVTQPFSPTTTTTTDFHWTLGAPKVCWQGTNYSLDINQTSKTYKLPEGYFSVGILHDVDTLSLNDCEGYMVGERAELFMKANEPIIFVSDFDWFVAFSPDSP